MPETEEERNIEPGELIYTTPACPLWRRGIPLGLALFFLFGGIAVVVDTVFSDNNWKEGLEQIFVLGIGSLLGTWASTHIIMNSHFRIYTNGLSFPAEHIHPFSACNNFDTRERKDFHFKGMRFISWADIIYFDERENEQFHSTSVYLNRENPRAPPELLSPFVFVVYRHRNNEKEAESRKALISALKEHGIPGPGDSSEGETSDD